MLFGTERGETREVFFRAWRTHREGRPLAGAEKLIVQIVLQHPEYHALLEQPDETHDKDFLPETGETNPFLHLGMHIAIAEQLSLDQPSGIRGIYKALREKYPDDHDAQHRVMDCLGEMLWRAQHDKSTLDEKGYLDCLAQLVGKPVSGS